LSAAVAVAYRLGLSWADWADRLADLPVEKGRAVFVRERDDRLILDDTYNANPESLIGMLETICRLRRQPTIGVIGHLAELENPLSESAAHILEHLPKGLSHLYFTGETGRILAPLVAARYPTIQVRYLAEMAALIAHVKAWVGKAAVIGVKGSRSAHMERVVYALQEVDFSCCLTSCSRLNMCNVCPLFRSGGVPPDDSPGLPAGPVSMME
jgi:UDP-N-acetylmuramyl pentapeptide synthase